ncbi:interferon-induced GTP-binding protein Mx [Sarotherodon galilaeus]
MWTGVRVRETVLAGQGPVASAGDRAWLGGGEAWGGWGGVREPPPPPTVALDPPTGARGEPAGRRNGPPEGAGEGAGPGGSPPMAGHVCQSIGVGGEGWQAGRPEEEAAVAASRSPGPSQCRPSAAQGVC